MRQKIKKRIEQKLGEGWLERREAQKKKNQRQSSLTKSWKLRALLEAAAREKEIKRIPAPAEKNVREFLNKKRWDR